MKPKIYYTALQTFDADHKHGFSWKDYVSFSEIKHLKELVSLDGNLNRLLFVPDMDTEADWEHLVTDQGVVMFYFNTLDYVLENVKTIPYFNLLALVKEPNFEKADLATQFDFVGYDLITIGGDTSALSNGGGFDNTFLPTDLNAFGLISDYHKAKKIQIDLPLNNPDQEDTTCYLYEVWRHKNIGRKTN